LGAALILLTAGVPALRAQALNPVSPGNEVLISRALSALGTGPTSGYTARGAVILAGPRGAERGKITVETWGGSHCRMTLDLSHPGESRVLTATLDGKLTRVTGPRELVGVVP